MTESWQNTISAAGSFLFSYVFMNMRGSADKRLRRLYTTKKAVLIIEQLYDIRQEWNEILVNGLTPDECTEAERLLDKMAQNAWRYMNERS